MNFKEFLKVRLPEVVAGKSYEDAKYKIDFEILGDDSVKPNTEDKLINDILCTVITVQITITNKFCGDQVSYKRDVLWLPIKTDMGFKVGSTYKQILDLYDKAKGWYLSENVNKVTGIADPIDSTMSCLSTTQKKLEFYFKNNKIQVKYKGRKEQVSLGKFLKALTGLNYMQLIDKLGQDLFIITTLDDETSLSESIEEVYNALLYVRPKRDLNGVIEEKPDVSVMDRRLRDEFFSATKFPFNKASRIRLRSEISFTRAEGSILAQDLDIGNIHLKEGDRLYRETLHDLDNTDLTSLAVRKNEKIFYLRKYSYKENTLSPEELFSMVNMYACTLSGFGVYNDEYELPNRVFMSFENKVIETLSNNIDRITDAIISNLDYKSGILDQSENSLQVTLNAAVSKVNLNTEELTRQLRDANAKEVQLADNSNPIAFATKDNKVTSSYGGRASEGMVKIQETQMKHLDPIESPESDKIGKVHYPCVLRKIDEDGFSTAPYIRVCNGVILSEEPVYLTAYETQNSYIAEWNEKFESNDIKVMYNGTVITVPKEKVTLMGYSPFDEMGLARSCIPFQEFDNPKRLLMGSNYFRQAEQIIEPERPLVSTGSDIFVKDLVYTAKDLLAEQYLEVREKCGVSKEKYMEGTLKLVNTKIENGLRKYDFKVFIDGKANGRLSFRKPFLQKTNKDATFSYTININKDLTYQGDDIVIYHSSVDIKKYDILELTDFGHMKVDVKKQLAHGIAQGRNLKVGLKTYLSSNIDDALVIRRGLIYEHKLTTVVQKTMKEECSENENYVESFGIPAGANLTEDYMLSTGLPRVGTFLKAGSVYLCKYRIDKTVIGKVEYDMKKLRLPNNISGEVVSAHIEGTKAFVTLAQISPIEVGDKLVGRYGNKGVIARVVDDEDMPYDAETGEPLDIIFNCQGVPPRMNIGQLHDVGLGGAVRDKNKIAIVTPFKTDVGQLVIAEMEGTTSGLRKMIDGRTGMPFDRPIFTGMMYILKLEHRINKKLHSINFTKRVNSITNQPVKGAKNDGGQSFSEMESWCLGAANSKKLLQSLFTVQSNDEHARIQALEQIAANPYDVHVKTNNDSDEFLEVAIRTFGGDLQVVNNQYQCVPLTDQATRNLAPTPLSVNNTDSIYNMDLFSKTDENNHVLSTGSRWGWVNLNCEIVHPQWINGANLNAFIIITKDGKHSPIGKETLKETIQGGYYIEFTDDEFPIVRKAVSESKEKSEGKKEENRGITGLTAVVKLLKTCKLDNALAYYQEKKASSSDNPSQVAELSRKIYAINQWKEKGIDLTDFIITTLPIMPIKFRPMSPPNATERVNAINQHYKRIFSVLREISNGRADVGASVKKLYDRLESFLGYDKNNNADKIQNFRQMYFGSGSEGSKGIMRENIMGKRLHLSGRSVIIPARDMHLELDQIGLPIIMAVEIFRLHLRSLLRKLPESKDWQDFDEVLDSIVSENLIKFAKNVNMQYGEEDLPELQQKFYEIKKKVVTFLETRIVIFGRQPSLHKFAVRGFRVVVTYTKAIELNPLTCKGYNADFDGDQMYVVAPIDNDAATEAIENNNPKMWVINPKDGSCILEHVQDMVLGTYYATILHNNVTSIEDDKRYENIFFADSLAQLKTYVYSKEISIHDLACVTVNGNNYISTAGRILFNAIVDNGFTNEPFTNNLKLPTIEHPECKINIPPIDPNNFKNLRFDGIMSSRGRSKDNMVYYSLSEYTRTLSRNLPVEEYSKIYQDIMIFGFEWCDYSGITISLNDLDINVDIPAEIEKVQIRADKINNAYFTGLISQEGRKTALIDLYNSLTKHVKEDIIEPNLPRNNNLFLMLDSNARGNLDQIMQTLGLIGISMKTSTESLETPILNSYGSGLTSFELFLASYGARMGANSTQYETPKAGYATRQAVYMCNGVRVVEKICDNPDTSYKVYYGDVKRIELSTGQVYTKETFENVVKDNSLAKTVSSEIATNFVEVLEGKTLAEEQEDGLVEKVLKNFLPLNNLLSAKCVKQIFKHHIRTITLTKDNKEIECKITYEMDVTSKDQLLYRRLEKPILGIEEGTYLTEKDIAKIEESNIETVYVRTMLNCRSHNGICAECYGLKFDSLKLPEVGEYVGFESAQYIGEPAAQLAISLINKGGTEGGANKGVQFLQNCLHGTMPDKNSKSIISIEDQYADIKLVGKKCYISNNGRKYVVSAERVAVESGEFLPFGTEITYGTINLNEFGDTTNNLDIIRRRQEILLRMYHNNYLASKIEVHARHFEILVRVQTTMVTILNSDNEEFKEGVIADLPDVLNAIDKGSNISYYNEVAKQLDVIAHFGGQSAAMVFERFNEVLGSVTLGQQVSKNTGLLAQLAVGEDITDKYDKDGNLLPSKRKHIYRGQENTTAESYATSEIPVYTELKEDEIQIMKNEEIATDEIDIDLDEIELDESVFTEPEETVSENNIEVENNKTPLKELDMFS